MVFDFKEDACSIAILKILALGSNKYMAMYSSMDYYFTTYQKSINFLIEKGFVRREEFGYKKVDYCITDKGRKFLELNLRIQELLK